MNTLSDAIVRVCAQDTMDLMRNRPDLQWAPESYWWPGIQLAWHQHFRTAPDGDTLTARELNDSLIRSGVPASSIRQSGKHTLVELDNISFVYRDKQFKYALDPVLQVSPQLRGTKYSECGHAFVNPRLSADETVAFMLAVDESVPAAQAASLDAYQAGLRERKIREVKQQVAKEYLDRLFQGKVPLEIESCSIADSKPGAMDLIRLNIRKKGRHGWTGRRFYIPYDDRDLIPGPEWIKECISTPVSHICRVEMFVDEDTGEVVPILRCEGI